MMTPLNTPPRVKRQSFTLIELLIVIGLLGALTALILPTLSANREEALGAVCDYNQAGSVRTLKQYANLVNRYPADLHNGLTGTTAAAVAMDGLPSQQARDMITNISTTRHSLTANQAASLVAAGITSVCSGTGLNSTAVAADVHVCSASGTTPWDDDSGTGSQLTFDGITVSNWATATGTPSWDASAGPVICLWIAPTVNWAAGSGDNNDWSKGNVELAIDMEGSCPIPTAAASGDEVSFAYYMAYFKVYNDGSPARLIGSTCPEDGALNP